MNPQTRLRITTRSPRPASQPTEQTSPGSGDEEETSPGDEEETTVSYKDETTEPEYVAADWSGLENVNPSAETPLPTLRPSTVYDFSTFRPSTLSDSSTIVYDPVSTTIPDVHETADKHSTFLPLLEDLELSSGSVDESGLAQEYLSSIDLDIHNEILDQVFEETQNVPSAWSEGEATPVPAVFGRLTSYNKDINTSHYGVDHQYEASDLSPSVNEHGIQGLVNKDGEVDALETDSVWNPSIRPFKPYVEIDRSAGNYGASVEEVEITESKDYSEPDIIYDDSKVGFGDEENKNYYSVPVSVHLHLPETTVGPEVTSVYPAETTTLREEISSAAKETSTRPEETTTVVEETTEPEEESTTPWEETTPIYTPTVEVLDTTVAEEETTLYSGAVEEETTTTRDSTTQTTPFSTQVTFS